MTLQLRCVLVAGLTVITTLPSVAQVSGAIFTTKIDGTTVNANIYDHKDDVYLNGGPQNKNGPALPPGTYYFQVTDPSGATLLSTDFAACRQIYVNASGVVYGVPAILPAACIKFHELGNYNSANGNLPVQLALFSDTPNAGGEYKAWLIATDATVPGCTTAPNGTDLYKLDFVNSCAKTDNFKIKYCESCTTPPSTLSGLKYYDFNTNGVLDSEVSIPNWRVDVTFTPFTGTASSVTTFTGTAGTWGLVIPSGTNSVLACEILPPSSTYIQTGPLTTAISGVASATASRCWTASNVSNDITALDFGNVCLGGGGGLTLGFWSNKNGQALFNSGDLAALVALNLRNANGSNFDPSGYKPFHDWLLSATATNMSYMLSAQLSAMTLNVRHTLVNGTTLIYAPLSTFANQAGFDTVDSVIAQANAALLTNGSVLSGNPNRPYMEALKNYLDAANNNKNFVQSGPCAFTSPY
jgi:hypothetical protein